MGMFDSFYNPKGQEWQTKALGRTLARFDKGDLVPAPLPDCQFEVIGDGKTGGYRWSYATIRKGRLTSVPARRDARLPLVSYSGDISNTEGE